jgi:hypothetical protein
VDPTSVGNLQFANSDIAFRGDLAFLGSFHGFNIYDISNPASPRLRVSYPCPGGQGDLSVHGDLLFMSVEETRGRIDCGPQGTEGSVEPGAVPRRAHLRHQRCRRARARSRRCRRAAARTRTRW